MVLFVVIVLIPVACGFIASTLAKKKNRSAGGFFALGFFLGVIGIVIAAVVSPGQPAPPPGMRAITCPRCNAVQNVDPAAPEFTCWQCHTASPVRA
ncbi:hypothetical protein BOH72_01780 [Mycobacterium sp. WY10]|nr:hypothetical protein BOH72_01780 [Mycobacterium sp. WY10]